LFYFLCLSLLFPSVSTGPPAMLLLPGRSTPTPLKVGRATPTRHHQGPGCPTPRIDGLHVCTYQAFLKSLNFYLHLPTHTQYPKPVRSMVASRATGVASSGRRKWPSVRGGRWARACRRRRHLDRQGRPRSASELWEDRLDLGIGAERGD
jgi:hypothetical protein